MRAAEIGAFATGWIALAAALYLFTTMVHCSVLGALLTFASQSWYAAYRHTTSTWGLTPLEDQQLGGLIMWVPASLVYVAVGLLLLARWISASDAQAREWVTRL